MGNKKIITAVAAILNAQTDYGFFVDYDSQENPIIKIASKRKIKNKIAAY